jgi:hypothetical protein
MNDQSLHEHLRSVALSEGVEAYLEIGCREGDSLRQVVANSAVLRRVVVCDMWGPLYGGTGRGTHAHIDAMLNQFVYTGEREFHDGDSKVTVPKILGQFDLVLVDGDHSAEGALADLRNCWPLVARGGQLVFHDVLHPAHRYLRDVFAEFIGQQEDCWRVSWIMEGHGVACAWKIPRSAP